MSKPSSTTVLDGLYDRLVDERLSAELASLIQANQASVLPRAREISLIPATVSDRFSGPHFGAIVGAGLMGSAAGSAAGPWLAGRLYDATRSYTAAASH